MNIFTKSFYCFEKKKKRFNLSQIKIHIIIKQFNTKFNVQGSDNHQPFNSNTNMFGLLIIRMFQTANVFFPKLFIQIYLTKVFSSITIGENH